MKDWDANLYTKFEKQRTQPSKDLISSIEILPKTVLDLGCGPGNSTEQLCLAFPGADIIGTDKSPGMLDQAKKRLPECTFTQADANMDLSHLGKFDLVFSNAVLQWLPSHTELITKLFKLLNPGGALAVQIPNVRNMKIQTAIREAVKTPEFKERFEGFFPYHINEADYYYDILSKLSNDFYLWETKYYHILESHQSIIDWYSSTGFRPYHAKLTKDEIPVFNDRVLSSAKKHYKALCDGSVMFPFIRLFFVVYNR